MLSASNVTLSLGGVLNVTKGNGHFEIAATGIKGHIDAQLSVIVPGVSLTGTTLGIDVDTTTATPSLKLGGTGVLTIAGQTLSGSFFFTQAGTATHLSFDNVHLFLGDPAGVGLDVTQTGTASFDITPAGVTGQLSANFTLQGLNSPDFVLPTIGVTLKITPTTLRVELTTGADKVSIFGQQFGGTFSFERVIGAGAGQAAQDQRRHVGDPRGDDRRDAVPGLRAGRPRHP